jgi:ADP-ribose pyrophosphatase YjhB (NUDIX family)
MIGAVPRISVKGLIIDGGRILLPMHRDERGDYFMLPGGGQEHGETVVAALERECREELGVDVKVGDLLGVRDYIAKHHEFAATDDAHQVELMFRCTLVSDVVPAIGPNPDPRQVGAKWLVLSELDQVRFYPRRLAEILAKSGDRPFGYLGDVN